MGGTVGHTNAYITKRNQRILAVLYRHGDMTSYTCYADIRRLMVHNPEPYTMSEIRTSMYRLRDKGVVKIEYRSVGKGATTKRPSRVHLAMPTYVDQWALNELQIKDERQQPDMPNPVEPSQPPAEPTTEPDIVADGAELIAAALLRQVVEKLRAASDVPINPANEVIAAQTALRDRLLVERQELRDQIKARDKTIEQLTARVNELGLENEKLRGTARYTRDRGGNLSQQISDLLSAEDRERLAALAKRAPEGRDE